METNYYYLYETVNLTNGKKYIGQHCTHKMDDNYFGSSTQLKEDIKSGHRYKVNVLKTFDNIYELGFAEFMEIKNRNAIKDPTYYNKDGRIHFNYAFIKPKKTKKKKTKK